MHTSPPPLRILREQLHVSHPALPPTSPTAQAGLVVLAATYVGHNIDRIARYTGLDRHLVSRCARRLQDNGVWRDGRTVCDWHSTDHTFWNDVGVAEGKLCRRIGATGAMEWASAGFWSKHCDYRETAPPGELAIRYHAPDERAEAGPETAEPGEVAPGEAAEEAGVPERRRWRPRGGLVLRPLAVGSLRGKRLRVAGLAPGDDRAGSLEIFPNVEWLR